MRLNHPVRDEFVDDDAPLPGPIIIVPASKTPPASPAAPERSPGRERLTRAGFAVAGAGVTLALTLAVQGWLGRSPVPAAPPLAPRTVAPIVVVALPPVHVSERGSDSVAVVPVSLDSVATLAVMPAEALVETTTIIAAAPVDTAPAAVTPAPPAPVRLASNDVAIPTSAPSVEGAWYHMDVRTRLADSLVVVFLADGRATALEQRWTLQRRGWQPERTAREGRWELRDTHGRATELCVTWTRPAAPEACAIVQPTPSGMRMEFAGRYWQRAACVEPSAADTRLPVQVRATTATRPATGD